MKLNLRYFLVVIGIILLVIVMFIWGHSIVSFDASVNESRFFLNLVRPVYESIFGQGAIDDYLWRKIAHAIEFFGLGIFTAIFFTLLFEYFYKYILLWTKFLLILISSEIICIVVAVIDELIQCFNDRHSQIGDVMLDSFSSLVAIMAISLVFVLITIIIKARKQ